MRALIVFSCLTMIAGVAFGQGPDPLDPDTYEQVLVPLNLYDSAHPLLGANGSQWVTELWGYNVGNSDVLLNTGNPYCGLPGGCDTTSGFNAMVPGQLSPLEFAPYGVGGIFNVERGRSNDLRLQMRLYDASREGQNLGTEVPLVRQSQFLRGRTALMAIPVQGDARVTLRLYDPTGGVSGEQFRVTIYPELGKIALTETTLTINPRPKSQFGLPFTPGYVEWFSIELSPSVVGQDRVRLEIEPLAGDPTYWAMISVTNNSTQMVTIISPQ